MKTTRRNFFKNALAGVGGAFALLFAGKTPAKEKKSVFLKPVRIKPGHAELSELEGTWAGVWKNPVKITMPPGDEWVTVHSMEPGFSLLVKKKYGPVPYTVPKQKSLTLD